MKFQPVKKSAIGTLPLPLPYPITINLAHVDPDAIKSHLAMLFQDVEWTPKRFICIRGIGEKGTSREKERFRDQFVFCPFEGDPLPAIIDHAKRWAQNHAAAFVVPAVLKGPQAIAALVELFSSVCVDLDNGDIDAKLAFLREHIGEPSMVVLSGGVTAEGFTKRHAYYSLSVPSADVQGIVRLRDMLARKAGGDISMGLGVPGNPYGRAHQPIRIAGTCHAKHGKAAPCSIESTHPAAYDNNKLRASIEAMPSGPWCKPDESEKIAPVDFSKGELFSTGATNSSAQSTSYLTETVPEGGEGEATRYARFSQVAGHNIHCARIGQITEDQARSNTLGWVATSMLPPWPEERATREFNALLAVDVGKHGGMPESKAGKFKPRELPPVVSLISLSDVYPDPAQTLLGNRFLCRGGGMLFIGPSGIGKSSAGCQQDIMWALGREAFGIAPAKPLRMLTIQAENDDGDLGEMARGVLRGMEVTDEQKAEVTERVLYASARGLVGKPFLALVARLLEKHRPDLLRIDPLLAYIGDDVNDAKVTAAFLREGLNPLLTQFNCGVIINHHTPKVTNRDTSNWRPSDQMYAGAGSADLTNWGRGALVIEPTHITHVFRFYAAKRGTRIGWADEKGDRQTMRLFTHDRGDGICWRPATKDDLTQLNEDTAKRSKSKKGGPKKTADDLLRLIPMEGLIRKNSLIDKTAKDAGFGENLTRALLNELLDTQFAFSHSIKRTGTRDEIWISREPQDPLSNVEEPAK